MGAGHEKARVVEEVLVAAEGINNNDDDNFTEEFEACPRRARFGVSVPDNSVGASTTREDDYDRASWMVGRPSWMSVFGGQNIFPQSA